MKKSIFDYFQNEIDSNFNIIELGVCYYNGQWVALNYEKAVEWYIKAAEQGNEISKHRLANIKISHGFISSSTKT